MEFSDYLGKTVRVEFINGRVITGVAGGMSYAPDNDESGEDELNVWTNDGRIYEVLSSTLASIQVLEPAQSKKRFPLVAASL
jgi:hypothetical protein